MPYIKQEDRDKFIIKRAGDFNTVLEIDQIKELTRKIENCGELNYTISIICKEYFKKNGGRYQQINDIIGALEGCKLEYYRRSVSKYEDEKIKENGDVY